MWCALLTQGGVFSASPCLQWGLHTGEPKSSLTFVWKAGHASGIASVVSQRKEGSLLAGSFWCKSNHDHSCVLIKASIQKPCISMTWFAGSSTEEEDNPFALCLLPLVWPRGYNTEKSVLCWHWCCLHASLLCEHKDVALGFCLKRV